MDKTKFKEYVQLLLTEAVRINNGKEAYELIKTNKLGVKLDPSYKVADEKLIPYLDKVVKEVGANNAPFAIQLLANKVPTESLNSVINGSAFKEIIACKNKPWAKTIPGYKEAIDFSSKEKYDQSKWSSLASSLQSESQKHGKSNKGSGSLKDVKELYNDGTWTLQVPTSWDGAKAASFYGKKGEKPTPAQWCTRADKRYYDMYTKNSPLYIIRNMETGDAYQIAFDKLQAYVLDKKDSKGDKLSQGDLNDVPDKLLKFIKWNGRSLVDFKKEFNRTELKKGELKNPTTDFNEAEWEEPKDEGDGIVSQVMHNLHNDEGDDNFTTFMIKGKPFKFNKRNNYAKKYYYKDKPKYVVIAVLSKKGNIKDSITWPFQYYQGKLISVSSDYFSKELVQDNGFLFNKANNEKLKAYKKREERANIKSNQKKNISFMNKMATLLRDNIKKEYVKNGLIDEVNEIFINTNNRGKSLYNNDREIFGNFIPIQFTLDIYPNENYRNYRNYPTCSIDFTTEGMKCKIVQVRGLKLDKELKDKTEKITNKAIKEFSKEAIHDEYGRSKRIEAREKSKGAAMYDIDSSKRLQFENYFPY